MNKEQYKKILFGLTAGVRDALKDVVEWIDGVLSKNRERDFEFREKTLDYETNLDGKIVAESMGETELFGLKKTEKALKTEWFLTQKDIDVLKLNYKEFQVFKSALKEVLAKQPYGYEKSLKHPPKTTEAEVIEKDGKVFLVFGKEKPIYIAKTEEKQGKLLLLLNEPHFGVGRSIEAVAEAIGAKEKDTYLAKSANVALVNNTVKEIQRKLAEAGKRNTLHVRFGNNTVRLEID